MAYDGTVKIGTELDGSGAEKGLKGLGRIVASSAVVAAIGSIGKAILSSYAEYEQLVGGVDTLFKGASAQLQQYAANAYKTAGMSANQYMAAVTGFSASLIQSLGGDTKAAVEYADMAMTDMADNANKFGTAMESIQFAYQGFAKQNYTMLDNLKLGYGGTKEEMLRLLEDAEKLSGLKFDISSFADVTQAIHIVQESMGVAGATAAEAEHTITGSINALKSAWANLLVGLADSNADVGKLAADVVKQFKTVARNVLPVIGEIVDSIPGLKQLKDMLPVIAAVGAAFAAWKAVGIITGIANAFQTAQLQVLLYSKSIGVAVIADAAQLTVLTAKEIVVGVLTGKITLAAAAQQLWNMALAAMGGPIGLAILAVTALIAGLAVLSITMNTSLKQTKALNKEIKESAKAMEEASEAFDAEVQATAQSAGAAEQLVSELEALENANSRTAEQEARRAVIVGELNSMYPEMALEIDSVTGALNRDISAIKKHVAAMQTAAQAEAYQQEAIRLRQEQIRADMQLKQAEQDLANFEEENVVRTQYQRREQELLTENVELLQGQYNELGDDLEYVSSEQEKYVDATAGAGAQTAAQAQEIENLAYKYGVAQEEIQAFVDGGGSLEEWAARQDAAISGAEESLNRLVDAYYNMNEKIRQADEMSLAERNANIEANQAAVDEYATNLDEIAAIAQEKGVEINGKLWEELQAGTPESMDLAADILASMQLDDGQWEQLNANFAAGVEGALTTVGENMHFEDGTNPAQAIVDEMVIALEADTSVVTATEGVVDDALASATARVSAVDFSQIGTNMMKGIENGIRSGTAGIVAAINEAVRKAHEEAQKIDDQHSPSKWWEKFGLNDMKGFAAGIESGAALVKQAGAGVLHGLRAQVTPAYADEGVSPGYGGLVNNYNMTINTHDSLSPYEQTQQFRAMMARGGWQLA